MRKMLFKIININILLCSCNGVHLVGRELEREEGRKDGKEGGRKGGREGRREGG